MPALERNDHTKLFLSQSKLAQLATKVGALIRRFEALPRFREKVVEWDRNHVQQREAEEAWEKKREEQERWACTQSRLLNESKDPPEPGWCFEGFYLCDVADQPVAFAVGPCIGAWFPPELCRAECPEVRRPLPVPNEEVELHEKYAALAAIHDYSSKDVDSINPWKDGPDNFEGVAYTHNLLRAVHRLPETDELRIYAWIEHVEQDLKAWATPAEATPTIDPLKAGVEPARSDTGNEWPPDDGLHFRPLEFAYQGKVYRLTGTPHHLFQTIATARKNLHYNEIVERVWKSREKNPEPGTVRCCLSDLKKALGKLELDVLAKRIEVKDEYWSFLD